MAFGEENQYFNSSRFSYKFVPQVEPAPVSNWSPSPRSTDSSPVTVGLKRSRENGQEAEADVEPVPKKAFGFEMKLNTSMVK